MSIKIKVSYQDEREARLILGLLKPIMPGFRVKKSEGKPPYKHIYFIPTDGEKTRN